MAVALQNLVNRRPAVTPSSTGTDYSAHNLAGRYYETRGRATSHDTAPDHTDSSHVVSVDAGAVRSVPHRPDAQARPSGGVLERPMCLNDLITRPAYTFLVRVQGHSLVQAGIIDGDLLVVDRSVKHRNNDFVVAAVQGELTVKRIEYRNGAVRLVSANPDYAPIDIIDDMRFEVLGVVTHVVHFMR